MKEFKVKMEMEIYYRGDSILLWDIDRPEEWEAFLDGNEEEILELIKEEVDDNCGLKEDDDGNIIKDYPDDYGVIFRLASSYNDLGSYELARYGRTWL